MNTLLGVGAAVQLLLARPLASLQAHLVRARVYNCSIGLQDSGRCFNGFKDAKV